MKKLIMKRADKQMMIWDPLNFQRLLFQKINQRKEMTQAQETNMIVDEITEAQRTFNMVAVTIV